MDSQDLILAISNTFNYSHDGVYIKNQELCYAYMNQTALRFLEFDQEELLSSNDFELFPDEAAIYTNHDRLAMQNIIFFQLDRVCTRTGKEIFALSQKLPLKTETGRIIGCLGISQYFSFSKLLTFISQNSELINRISFTFNIQKMLQNYTHLSLRELEVLHYLLQGYGYKNIAYALNISPKTIIFHTNNIKEKWQCISKQAICQKAMQLQLISSSIQKILRACPEAHLLEANPS